MVLRLVVDHVRRASRDYFWSWLLLALFWTSVAPGRIPAGMGIAMSIAIAFYIGPVATGLSFPPRLVTVLPVSSRQVWIAKWMLHTVIATMCTTIGKLTGLTGQTLLMGATPDLSLVVLSGLFDFAYTGALFGMLPAFSMKPRGSLVVRRIALWGWLALALLTYTSVVWPFVFRDDLPTEWADLSGASGAVLLAALALSVVGYHRTPATVAPHGATRVTAPPAGAGTATPSRVWIWHRFTGIRYVLWREALISLCMAVGALTVMATIAAIHPARGTTPVLVEFREAFSQPLRTFPYFDGGWFFLMVFVSLPVPPTLPSPRHLRALPLSAAGVNGLALAVPFFRLLASLGVVAVLLVLQTGGVPASFRWGVFFWFLGLSALAHAIHLGSTSTLRLMGTFLVIGVYMLTLVVKGGAIPPLQWFSVAYPTNVIVSGLIALSAAVLLNHVTLTRRHAIYRPAPIPRH